MTTNHNRQLELIMRAIAAEAEMLANKIQWGSLWEGDARKTVGQIAEKICEAQKLTKNDR